MSTNTSGASIRYTTDGSQPTSTMGTLYSGPVAIASTTTLNAIGYATGWNTSTVSSAIYTITGTVAAPTFSLGTGTYSTAQSLTMSTSTTGASMRYTTDGSTPSATAGTLYTGPVVIGSTTILSAIAYETGWNTSPVTTATYTISVRPVISSMSIAGGPVGAKVNITGSNFGATQGTSTITFNGVSAGIASVWNNTSIRPTVPSGAATGNVVITVNGISSTGTTFTVTPPPNITTLSPTTGTPGAQVTISGTGFGLSQGPSTVWLGTSYASVVSWSNTQIIATVANNAQSGTAQVQVAGVGSTPVAFNVNTATISSITPNNGIAGMQVTIAGSGFGATQGSGQVWLGTASGVVQTWSDTSIVAQVGAGSATGNAQVLQNGVMSNSKPFTIDTPQITNLSMTSAAPGASVTFNGSGFGTSTGTVWLGSTSGSVVSWNNTTVVATVAQNALTGIARIQQNGAWSNALAFTVTGSSVKLLPVMLNMVVGDTHTIQALNSTGQSVTGLTWTSSNTSIVSLSTDDPPILTALAAGHITITAGAASADIAVSATTLSLGTTIWSNPGDGSGVTSIVPAVPSPTGVADVFAFQNDGAVMAITSDGTTAWTAISPDPTLRILPRPDFQGGLIGVTLDQNYQDSSIVKIDGLTGQSHTVYTPPVPLILAGSPLIHTDGTLFEDLSSTTFPTPPRTVARIDPSGQVSSVPYSQGFGCWSSDIGDGTWAMGSIIAGDGYAYFAYACREGISNGSGFYTLNHVMLLRISPDGAYDNIHVADWTGKLTDLLEVTSGLITNADTGVLLMWQPVGGQSQMAITNGTSVSLMSGPEISGQQYVLQPVLQAQDGSFVGLAHVGQPWTNYMVTFDQSGSIRWVVPNEQPQIATADGGVIGKSGITYDQNGNATGQINLNTYSWSGNSYHVGSIDQEIMAWVDIASSYWPFAGGNTSHSGTANKPLTLSVQQLIAQKALNYVGSHNWPDAQGHNQCNLFVKQVLKDAGLNPPSSPVNPSWQHRAAYYLNLVDTPGYPAQARDWATPSTNLKCWRQVTINNTGPLGPQLPPGTLPPDISIPGDVIAEAIDYSDATGHVGFVVGPQQTESADSAAACMSPGTLAGIIDITNFGFRADGSQLVSPAGQVCSTHGWKSKAVVKRFVCQ